VVRVQNIYNGLKIKRKFFLGEMGTIPAALSKNGIVYKI